MVSAELIEEALQGAKYPITRADLIMHATTHGAPHEVLHLLYKIPEREYHASPEVWDEINHLRHE